MYKVTIPIDMTTMRTEEDLRCYLEDVRRCGAQRVFISGIGNVYMKLGRNYTEPERIRWIIDYFHAAVLLANVHLDDVFAPEIQLDQPYKEIRFLNCTGKLAGDRVVLSDLPPYGIAAFEVK